MKRLLLAVAILCAAAFLGGCPVYSENRVCDSSGCYSCPSNSYSGACIKWPCSQDSDCAPDRVCSADGQCVPPPPPSDCSISGCPAGYACKLANGVAQCAALPGSGSDAGVDSGSTSGPDAGSGGDSAATSEGGDGSVASTPCNADTDCGGHGAKCVDGACAAQLALCSDATQCNVAGFSCVDGLCEPRCSGTVPCPSGYGCDFTRGVCNLDPGGCTGSGTSSCQGGATCVEGHCVPPCDAAIEAGSACAAGQVCVNGGCIPDQAATFTCTNDGDEGLVANDCAAGFICLHHDCYAGCQLDGGTCTAGSTSLCKEVTIETGTYTVCAAPGTLGSGCDPAQGKYCPSGVCIDGTCE